MSRLLPRCLLCLLATAGPASANEAEAPRPVDVNRGLAFRLGGDDRLTMRLRKGSLGLYYRRNFCSAPITPAQALC
jgi:hypothetical protein